MSMEHQINGAPAMPRFSEALRFWVKLGLISFGGPAGQIAIMHRELAKQRRRFAGC
jgi:chromate transporter